jgi:hypothetical protein
MNERINDLRLAAGICRLNDDQYLVVVNIKGEIIEPLDGIQKFAELIIQECAKVSEDDITDGDACCTNTAYRIASQIKKHFGVEDTKREQFDRAIKAAFKDGADLSGKETP